MEDIKSVQLRWTLPRVLYRLSKTEKNELNVLFICTGYRFNLLLVDLLVLVLALKDLLDLLKRKPFCLG